MVSGLDLTMGRLRCGTTIGLLALCLALVALAATPVVGQAPDRPAASAVPSPTPRDDPFIWHDARTLSVEGRGWDDTETFFERLPSRAKDDVPEMVWQLGKNTAGIAVRFISDSPQIAARWDGGGAMYHMAATGNSGLDLYVRTAEGWRFRGVGKPDVGPTMRVLASDCPAEPGEYLLYLPLYHAVTELQIGVERGASLTPAPARPVERNKPIVFYGTSITQGGCASRAGMCHAAILGRWFDRPVVNLGFSGSGKMEPAMGGLLGELDAAVFVLECLPNLSTEMVRERVGPFVRGLRERRPETPVLLVESPLRPGENPDNEALREVHAALLADGVSGLYYLPGEAQLAGRENGTVDGVHPTDLGFLRMATAYEPVLAGILGPQ